MHFRWNRYEIDKVTAGQRLDLNLERGYENFHIFSHDYYHFTNTYIGGGVRFWIIW